MLRRNGLKNKLRPETKFRNFKRTWPLEWFNRPEMLVCGMR